MIITPRLLRIIRFLEEGKKISFECQKDGVFKYTLDSLGVVPVDLMIQLRYAGVVLIDKKNSCFQNGSFYYNKGWQDKKKNGGVK